MTRYLDIYGWFIKQRFKILMEYRVNFFIGAVSTIFEQAATLASIWVIMTQVPILAGWNFDEVLLVYGLITISKSINHMFADNLWTIGRQYVRTGAFDRFLVRPLDPLFHLLADRFCHDGIGNLIVGVVLITKAAASLGIQWTPFHLFYLVVAVVSGGVIFIALNLFTATTAFWVVDSIPITQIVFDTHNFARYPISIYGKGIVFILTWLIPYGFASYYPAAYLLGRTEGPIVWMGPVVAVVLLFGAYRFWLFGLKHYSGTGS